MLMNPVLSLAISFTRLVRCTFISRIYPLEQCADPPNAELRRASPAFWLGQPCLIPSRPRVGKGLCAEPGRLLLLSRWPCNLRWRYPNLLSPISASLIWPHNVLPLSFGIYPPNFRGFGLVDVLSLPSRQRELNHRHVAVNTHLVRSVPSLFCRAYASRFWSRTVCPIPHPGITILPVIRKAFPKTT